MLRVTNAITSPCNSEREPPTEWDNFLLRFSRFRKAATCLLLVIVSTETDVFNTPTPMLDLHLSAGFEMAVEITEGAKNGGA